MVGHAPKRVEPASDTRRGADTTRRNGNVRQAGKARPDSNFSICSFKGQLTCSFKGQSSPPWPAQVLCCPDKQWDGAQTVVRRPAQTNRNAYTERSTCRRGSDSAAVRENLELRGGRPAYIRNGHIRNMPLASVRWALAGPIVPPHAEVRKRPSAKCVVGRQIRPLPERLGRPRLRRSTPEGVRGG